MSLSRFSPEEPKDLTWRHAHGGWFLFTNNHYKLPKAISQEDASKKSKKPTSAFYYTSRKPETKGTVAYTPSGYGIIQEIRGPREKIPIKLNSTGKIEEFEPEKVFLDIPISITFLSSAMQGSDTLTIPITMSPKDIINKIETSFLDGGDNVVNVQVFFKGRDLSQQSNFTLEKLGIVPNSKFLAMPEVGVPFCLKRFTNVYEGWGYSDKCINAIAFSTNKSIKIRGFGIYCPDNSYGAEGAKKFSAWAKFIVGTDDSGQVLFSKEVTVAKSDNSEEKVFKFYFDRPIRIKAGETYSCVQEAIGNYNCYTHYGDSGQYEIIGEKDIVFSFVECYTSMNNTNRSCGQIPEIYYYA